MSHPHWVLGFLISKLKGLKQTSEDIPSFNSPPWTLNAKYIFTTHHQVIEKRTLSLRSSGPTPWVNEAGLTPCHPKAAPSAVPALAVVEPDAAVTERGRAAQEELGASLPKLLLPTQRCTKGENQPRVWRRVIATQLSSSFKGFPNQMLLFTGPQLFPVLPHSGTAWWTDCLAWMQTFLLPQFAQSFLGLKM